MKVKRNKINIILGAVVLFIEYFASCFFDTIGGGKGFTIIPYQLVCNIGHMIGFIVGVIFALVVCLAQLNINRNVKQ